MKTAALWLVIASGFTLLGMPAHAGGLVKGGGATFIAAPPPPPAPPPPVIKAAPLLPGAGSTPPPSKGLVTIVKETVIIDTPTPGIDRINNQDFPGGDLRAFAATGFKDCEVACAGDSSCVATVYGKNQCTLKRSISNPIPFKGIVSGLKSAAVMPARPGIQRLPGFIGSPAYKSFATASYYFCETACLAEKECAGSTYSNGTCGLHNRLTEPKGTGAVTGIRTKLDSSLCFQIAAEALSAELKKEWPKAAAAIRDATKDQLSGLGGLSSGGMDFKISWAKEMSSGSTRVGDVTGSYKLAKTQLHLGPVSVWIMAAAKGLNLGIELNYTMDFNVSFDLSKPVVVLVLANSSMTPPVLHPVDLKGLAVTLAAEGMIRNALKGIIGPKLQSGTETAAKELGEKLNTALATLKPIPGCQ